MKTRASALVLTLFGALSSCLFAPSIEDDGYFACTSDADCGAGRSCAVDVGLCAPPPWRDPAFFQRQAIVVTNGSETDIAAGVAVPITVGGPAPVLELDAVLADARYANYDVGSGAWNDVPVYRDLSSDRFTVWAPLSRPLAAGRSDVLVWLEQSTEAGAPTFLDAPAQAFALFDELDAFPADEVGGERYVINAPGAATVGIGESKITVPDNVGVVWRAGFVPPVSVTIAARVNGLTCTEVFVGVTGADAVGFNPPSAGFFIANDLQANADVYPTATSQRPAEMAPAKFLVEQPTALHRFTIDVQGTAVRLSIDDVVFDERSDLDQPFADDAPLFPTVQVGGACSLDVETVWATALPITRPTLAAEAVVALNITY
jgi:hypothetical protein